MKEPSPIKSKKQIAEEAKLFVNPLPKEPDASEIRRSRQRDRSKQLLSEDMQASAARYRLERIEEFAKTMPYSISDARAEHPEVDENTLVELWVGQRWLLAQAMVDLQPDLSVKFGAPL